VILSKVIFYQFLEKVQRAKISSSTSCSYPLKILPGSLSPQVFILSNPYRKVLPKRFLKKRFLMLSMVNIPFLGNSQPWWAISLKWIFISCFKPMKHLVFLEGFEPSKGCIGLLRKNRTVRFQKLDYPVFAGITPSPLDGTYPFTFVTHSPPLFSQEPL
jgi:hypothetical protein